MPDPTPSTRDRELAEAFVAAAIFAEFQAYQVDPDDMVAALAEFRAQARQEGREEGIEAAVKELRMLGNSRGAAQLNVRLINQPAPDRAKE